MGHHPQHVAAWAADAGYVFERSVGIRFRRDLALRACIAEDYAVVALQFGQGRFIAKIIAFHVSDGDGQDFAFFARIRERRLIVFHSYVHRLANIFQADIPHESSRQQSRFTQDLEAVADAQHQAALVGEFADGLHDRGELGDGAGAEVVAVSEPSWHDDGVAVLKVLGVVPKESYGLLRDLLDGPEGIVIAVGTGENNDAEFHRDPRVHYLVRGYPPLPGLLES